MSARLRASLGAVEVGRRLAVLADDDMVLPSAVRDEALALLTILSEHRFMAGDSAPGSYERARYAALARQTLDQIHRLLTGRSPS